MNVAECGDGVCAAVDAETATLFARDLARMCLLDWSTLCLRCCPDPGRGDGGRPAWALVAGLAALGFGRDVIVEGAKLPVEPGSERLVSAFVEGAADLDGAGLLLLLGQNPEKAGRSSDLRHLVLVRKGSPGLVATPRGP